MARRRDVEEILSEKLFPTLPPELYGKVMMMTGDYSPVTRNEALLYRGKDPSHAIFFDAPDALNIPLQNKKTLMKYVIKCLQHDSLEVYKAILREIWSRTLLSTDKYDLMWLVELSGLDTGNVGTQSFYKIACWIYNNSNNAADVSIYMTLALIRRMLDIGKVGYAKAIAKRAESSKSQDLESVRYLLPEALIETGSIDSLKNALEAKILTLYENYVTYAIDAGRVSMVEFIINHLESLGMMNTSHINRYAVAEDWKGFSKTASVFRYVELADIRLEVNLDTIYNYSEPSSVYFIQRYLQHKKVAHDDSQEIVYLYLDTVYRALLGPPKPLYTIFREVDMVGFWGMEIFFLDTHRHIIDGRFYIWYQRSYSTSGVFKGERPAGSAHKLFIDLGAAMDTLSPEEFELNLPKFDYYFNDRLEMGKLNTGSRRTATNLENYRNSIRISYKMSRQDTDGYFDERAVNFVFLDSKGDVIDPLVSDDADGYSSEEDDYDSEEDDYDSEDDQDEDEYSDDDQEEDEDNGDDYEYGPPA